MIAEQELKQIQAAHPHVVEQMYVWEAPVRLWHWGNFLAMITLMVTGYLIGSPPPAIGGEATFTFMFGWIRLLHFSAAYVFAIGLVVRALYERKYRETAALYYAGQVPFATIFDRIAQYRDRL